MKLPIIAAILLVLAVPAHARLRHDRICDLAQERVDPETYNPAGGNAVMFGRCEKIDEDSPAGDSISRSGFWNGLSCGYRAYREGKQLKDSPYKNQEKTEAWKAGWRFARKSCVTGRLPTFNSSDTE